jgi:hypothetical protein
MRRPVPVIYFIRRMMNSLCSMKAAKIDDNISGKMVLTTHVRYILISVCAFQEKKKKKNRAIISSPFNTRLQPCCNPRSKRESQGFHGFCDGDHYLLRGFPYDALLKPYCSPGGSRASMGFLKGIAGEQYFSTNQSPLPK